MNIIIYSIFNLTNFSGGLSIIRILFEKIKLYLPNNVYFCPLIEDIPELNFKSSFQSKKLHEITDEEFKSVFPTEMHPYVITNKIIKQQDNLVIYPEDIVGNPLKQKYIIRWLLYFPNQKSVQNYNFEQDLILFYDYSYYNLYKCLCKDLKMNDYLTEKINKPIMFKIMRFNIEKCIDYGLTRNGTCSTCRKDWPPYTFCNQYTRRQDFLNKKIKLNSQPNNVDFEFEDFLNDDQIIYLFNIKEKFICYDLFTYYTIQSALCGCISIVNPVSSISAEEYYKDPCNKYGIAYGDNFIDHAKKTMKYLRDYQYYLYYSHEMNFINLFKYIEEHFKINLNINYNSIDLKNEKLKLLFYKNRLDFELLLDNYVKK